MSEQAGHALTWPRAPQPAHFRGNAAGCYPESVRPRTWLWLVLICACAQDEGGVTDDQSIEGLVLDEFTERGVGGAKVKFVSDALDRAEATTDGDGRFVIDVELTTGVRFGTLEASRGGYVTSAKESVYFDGSALRMELTLRPSR